MVKTFKNFDKGALVALAVAGFFAISWTNAAHKLAPQWYQVTESGTDPDPEKNQHIVGLYPGGTPTNPCDETSGEICAIQLDFNPEETDMPSTVSEAKNLAEVTVGSSRFSQEN
ncbi:hypothetical protein FAZ19_20120 [Sphingobacterium alkalisoli]|uniref:Uncharacterized protein n=1 Tax=Sphingobacterium alkalisoli TaxID=1874115 RepID=A0A4U0GV34_9SPHI|nr:hypothetical protein [Sphingobacterium alkalisoli]TJY62776.1 hypothetical protein FAZ19_20120 [Sphingobacterium alkalisoli]GGH28833.1 hypothetical protein GCM10011418_39700 [Sphingobacterium alkalisoli]